MVEYVMNNDELIDKVAKLTLIIHGIAEIVTLPGEEYSDGECLDLIWHLLERNGYELTRERV